MYPRHSACGDASTTAQVRSVHIIFNLNKKKFIIYTRCVITCVYIVVAHGIVVINTNVICNIFGVATLGLKLQVQLKECVATLSIRRRLKSDKTGGRKTTSDFYLDPSTRATD